VVLHQLTQAASRCDDYLLLPFLQYFKCICME
jgi:hypothetical protein